MPNKIYMLGIGGIGMSGLAQLLRNQGKAVAGADREASPVTIMLQERGVSVEIGEGELPEDAQMVIYSDAVPSWHPVRAEARQEGITELSYFEALGEVSKNMRTIAVAGTHGKTTTTGMLAKILQFAEKKPTAIVGSIVRDFESNFLAGSDELFVVEACEYRDHVLKLTPDILVITNLELDHTDYFPDLTALQNTFRIAAEKVPASGFIITDPADPIIAAVLQNVTASVIDFTSMAVADTALIGEFNKMNARAAAAAALAAFPEIEQGTIDRALIDFKGSWRRFEYRGETPLGALVYDDYAHHPTAVEKTIVAAKEKFPGKRIVVAFHPHLHSRTQSFMNEFARALALADYSIVAPIYEARTEEDHTISNETLAEKTREAGGNCVAIQSFDQIRDALLKEPQGTLIITMGAGDIYKVAEQIAD
jgi:UDP-N-acetylmuramate--alanine ligase